MEGKPSFSGGAPESHQNINPEVSQWREQLGDPVWATPENAQKPEVTHAATVQPEVTHTQKPVVEEPAAEKLSKSAIDEALTDPKSDIAEVQQMVGHLFEMNREKDV